MELTEREPAFVERRARLARSWPWAGGTCLAVVLGLAVWLWLTRALPINPWAVLGGLETGSVPQSTLALMAAMLPVVVLACLIVLVLLFGFAAFGAERRLVRIVRKLADGCGGSTSAATAGPSE